MSNRIKRLNEEILSLIEDKMTRKDYIENENKLFEQFIIASFNNYVNRYLSEFSYSSERDDIISIHIDNKTILISLVISRSLATLDFEVYDGRNKSTPLNKKHYHIQGSIDMDKSIKDIYFLIKGQK